VAVAPPFTALSAVRKELEGSPIRLAAQNLFWEEKGAFTGEIAPPMLKEAGCHYVILGHSERRQFFGETDETVNRKVRATLSQGLKVIFCIGETLKEREEGRTFAVIERQVPGGLKDIRKEEMKNIVIAYEPVGPLELARRPLPSRLRRSIDLFVRNWLNSTRRRSQKGCGFNMVGA
jgi:triosephosphate isomerase